jgi:hypothetical protein
MPAWPRGVHAADDAARETAAQVRRGNLDRQLVLERHGHRRHVGSVSAAPVSADTSRATPWIDRQSALFGVSLIVKT